MTASNQAPSIVCVGDLMRELILQQVPSDGYERTLVLDPEEAELGGAVVNISWYLKELGRAPVLVSHFGESDGVRVRSLVKTRGFEGAQLSPKSSPTDTLLVLENAPVPAIYLAGTLSDADIAHMYNAVRGKGTNAIVFAGSRHRRLRDLVLDAFTSAVEAVTIFSPSYSVYEYREDELHGFLSSSTLIFLNEHEERSVVTALGISDLRSFMRSDKCLVVVTRGQNGARLYTRTGETQEIASTSGCSGDFIGAGDAFVAGFVHAFLNRMSWYDAGLFAAELAGYVVKSGKMRASLIGLSDLSSI